MTTKKVKSFIDILDEALKSSKNEFQVELITKSGRYTLGTAKRPDIKHDNGFLDSYPRREPTSADHIAYAYWVAKLRAAEAACQEQEKITLDRCGEEKLIDATKMYRHFLFGGGSDVHYDYNKYLDNDASGKKSKINIIKDFKENAEIIGLDRTSFSVTSEAYALGSSNTFPYPTTENWQKAIGGHSVWVSGDVEININNNGKVTYHAKVTFHAEDMYNFNPGAKDIKTGTPDDANGRFETSGLAHQFMTYGTATFQLEWVDGSYD